MPEGESISNGWIAAKVVGKGTLGAGSAIASGAQHMAGVSAFALATGAAAASATGIGLVVTGAVITLTTCGLSAVAAYKTGKHIEALERLQERAHSLECTGLMFNANRHEHAHIADDVLPYIIHQKEEKVAKKTIGVVPIAGSGLTSAYAIGRNLYKRARGTLGAKRNEMAFDLTKHFLTHNCALAQGIVSALYSYEEMIWLAEQNPPEVVKLLARKLASN